MSAIESPAAGARWLRTVALHAAAFMSGFVTMGLEMLIGRTFIPFFGGTIYTWGALISVFLAGMTAGYIAGGRCADRYPREIVLAVLFIVSAALVCVVPLCGEAAINVILDKIEDVRYAALLAALMLACLPAATLAAVSPYCVRLLLDTRDHAGTIAGRLSGLATAGSIVGTLGTSFFFIPTMGVKLIYAVLAAASLLLGICFLSFAWRSSDRKQASASVGGFVPVGVALLLFASFCPAVGAQSTSLLKQGDGLLEQVDSEYSTIFVEKRGSLISLNFGYRKKRYTESIIDLKAPSELVVPYTRYMISSVAYKSGEVKAIALIGLGGGRTISYLLSKLPHAVADVAELDPAVITLAAKYFGVTPHDRLRIHSRDGRVFLNQTRAKYDLILIDAYRGSFVPFHLTTQEFYRLARSRLSDGGVVAQNVAPSTLFFESAYATMKSVFDTVDAIQAENNIVLVGYQGLRLSEPELQRRAAVTQDKLQLAYDPRQLLRARKDVEVSGSAQILTDDFAPVEFLNTVKRHNEKRP